MTWDCLNRVVDKNVSELRLAKLIVIQLGSNDLGIKKTYQTGPSEVESHVPKCKNCIVRNTYEKVLAQCSRW